MTNIVKYSFGLTVAAASILTSTATATPLFDTQILPDTVITRVSTSYDATTNQFVQRTRYENENPQTTAFYRDDPNNARGDEITPLEWNLSLTVDENGQYTAGDGVFELFGAIDFSDPTKADLPYQLLLSGAIDEFGVTAFEQDFGFGIVSAVSYNILGRALYSAPGIDYNGYVGMIWSDNPTDTPEGGLRTDNQTLFGSDWESDPQDGNRAQADIFVVPAPSSFVLFGLAFLGMIGARRKAS